jgi:hypothetical protein
MTHHLSTAASNCDVHWLTFTRAEVFAALARLSGIAIPDHASVALEETDTQSFLALEWPASKQ